MKGCHFARKVMQRLCLSIEVIDKGAIITTQSAKISHFSYASWSGPRSDSGHFLRVTLDALCKYGKMKYN